MSFGKDFMRRYLLTWNQLLKQKYFGLNYNTLHPNIFIECYIFPEGGFGNLGTLFYATQGCKEYDWIGPNKTAIEVKIILSLAPDKYFSKVERCEVWS